MKLIDLLEFEDDSIKQWFGNSKITYTNGKPMILYHGTNSDFSEFDKEKQGGGYLGRGFYFSTDKDFAGSYGGKIKQAYLKMLNPFDLSSSVIPDSEVIKIFSKNKEIIDKILQEKDNYKRNSSIFDYMDFYNIDSENIIKSLGFDGVENEEQGEYVVFDNSQIKIIKNTITEYGTGRIVKLIDLLEFENKDKFIVHKQKDFNTDEGLFSIYDIEKDENKIRTRPSMFTVLKSPDGYIIRNSIIPDELRRKGIATQFYIKMNQESIKKTGKPLRSTQPRELISGEIVHELSNDAISLWDSFVRNGLAIKKGEKNYQFNSHVKESIIAEYGTGRITKQNTTKDIKMNHNKTMVAKYGFKVDIDGRPPLLTNKKPVKKLIEKVLNVDVNNKSIRVFENPTIQQIVSLINRQVKNPMKTPHLRGYVDFPSGNYYIWDAFDEIHGYVAKALGLEYDWTNRCDIMLSEYDGYLRFDCEFLDIAKQLPIINRLENEMKDIIIDF